MPHHTKDEPTAQLVQRLAECLGVSEESAVRIAVEAQLDRLADRPALRERFAALRFAFPLPERTGLAADKAFFGQLYDDDEDAGRLVEPRR